MLKEHKNRLLEIIQESEVDISKFEAFDQKNLRFVIELKNTPIVFIIQQNPDNFDQFLFDYTKYEPNFPFKSDTFTNDIELALPTYEALSTIEPEFNYWLNAVVKRYLYEKEMPDLWSYVRNYTPLSSISSIPEEDYQPFSDEQKLQIRLGLKEFKKLVVENYNPTKDQLEFISERLDYLSDAVDRLNRFDWKGLTLSILTSIAINLTIDTQGGKMLFELFTKALQSVIKLLLGS